MAIVQACSIAVAVTDARTLIQIHSYMLIIVHACNSYSAAAVHALIRGIVHAFTSVTMS